MTAPDEPTWTEQEIEARRHDAPAEQKPVIRGIDPGVDQTPDLFPIDDEEA